MNCVPETDVLSEQRMESFAGSGDGAMMTGKRRMGQVRLLEDFYEFLKNRFPEENIFVIGEKDNPESVLGDSLPRDSTVLIHFVSEFPDWESSIRKRAKGTVTVYCGQELCHQVPVCFKKILEIQDQS